MCGVILKRRNIPGKRGFLKAEPGLTRRLPGAKKWLGTVAAGTFELVVQSLGANAEDFRRASFVAVGEFDGARNHLLLDVFERAAERNLDEAAVGGARPAEVVGQVGFANRPAFAHDERALDDVAQLEIGRA